ncbi:MULTISPECIES: MBL fold metallo-hydrolase [unclassified Sphingomonas]|uniref:MBL fold metallo-hydrolase n=1 Tax=unclassified Sphingomonas TaxID=196159 RepID=UPI00226A0C1E|nr:MULTISPECIES: MBL fold metallo-hydrolase [unclassified Sphingomonas]
MALQTIVKDAYLIPMGQVNAVLLDGGDELTLVDAGFPGKEQLVFDAIAELGREASDLRHLVFTHHHPDHIGSGAAIVRATGARTYMHPLDVPIAEAGGPFRPMVPGSGLLPRLLYFVVGLQKPAPIEPVKIDQTVADGETLPIAGGLRVIATPGHCAGQVAYLWRGTRLLVAGDFATNLAGLGDPLGFEDKAEGRRSQRKIAGLDFDAIAFGHGKPITSGASGRVRRKWGQA